jgi:hypothetical protein
MHPPQKSTDGTAPARSSIPPTTLSSGRAGQARVERTCAEQGVPVKLTGPVALRRIADVLGEARDAREAARKDSRAA